MTKSRRARRTSPLAATHAVLVAPPLKSEGSAWWARYQPQDYRVIDQSARQHREPARAG
jgi:hypothetical protein